MEGRATLEQFRTYLSSAVHHDIEIELHTWIADIHGQLEVARDYQTVCRLQGNIEACRHFLQLPHNLVRLLEAEHE